MRLHSVRTVAVIVALVVAASVPGVAMAATVPLSAGALGRVVDSGGTGLSGIEVRAYLATNAWSDPNPVPTVSAVTDSGGLWSLTLPTDDQYVLAYVDPAGTYRDTTYPLVGKPLNQAWGLSLTPGTTEDLGDMPMYTLREVIDSRLQRVAGVNRYETCAKISRTTFPALVDTVVIASGAAFADALSAAPLAGIYGAPLLLTDPNAVPPSIATELRRLDPVEIIIVGGTGAVSTAAEYQLGTLGLHNLSSIRRVSGGNRYETSEKIAYEIADVMGPDAIPLAIFCRGDNFADALSVSPHAYYWGCPIILTPADHLDAAARRAWLHLAGGGYLWDWNWPDDPYPSMLYATVGGNTALSADTHNQIADSGFGSAYTTLRAVRLAGGTGGFPGKSDRYGTGRAVNTFFSSLSGEYDVVGVANGASFPDALAGGGGIGYCGGALILTPPTILAPDSSAQLVQYGPYIMGARVFGGAGSVSAGVFTASSSAMGTALYDIDDADHRVTPVSTLALSALETARLRSLGNRMDQRLRGKADSMDTANLPGVSRIR